MFTHVLDDRTSLRLLEAADAEQLHGVIVAEREQLVLWMPWAAEQAIEGTREFVRSSRRRWAADEGFDAAIVDDGRLAGCIGFSRMDRANRSASLGYWLAGASQGRGIVTRATAALLDHAFTTFGLHRVEIRAGTENVRSRRIPERLGFAREGVLRDAERIGERYIDHVVYAMLDRGWRRE